MFSGISRKMWRTTFRRKKESVLTMIVKDMKPLAMVEGEGNVEHFSVRLHSAL